MKFYVHEFGFCTGILLIKSWETYFLKAKVPFLTRRNFRRTLLWKATSRWTPMVRRSIYRYGWGDGQWSLLVLQLGSGHSTGAIGERSMTGRLGSRLVEFIGTTVGERSFDRCFWGMVNKQEQLGRRSIEFNGTIQFGNGHSTGAIGQRSIYRFSWGHGHLLTQ